MRDFLIEVTGTTGGDIKRIYFSVIIARTFLPRWAVPREQETMYLFPLHDRAHRNAALAFSILTLLFWCVSCAWLPVLTRVSPQTAVTVCYWRGGRGAGKDPWGDDWNKKTKSFFGYASLSASESAVAEFPLDARPTAVIPYSNGADGSDEGLEGDDLLPSGTPEGAWLGSLPAGMESAVVWLGGIAAVMVIEHFRQRLAWSARVLVSVTVFVATFHVAGVCTRVDHFGLPLPAAVQLAFVGSAFSLLSPCRLTGSSGEVTPNGSSTPRPPHTLDPRLRR